MLGRFSAWQKPHELFGANKTQVKTRYNIERMWNAFRYYWTVARGYRLRPWNSPYLQWRFETYLGKEAANLDARKFFELSWQHRKQLQIFINWAAERRKVQQNHY